MAAAKLAGHGGVAQVGDVRHHAGDGEADAGAGVGGVVAVVPIGILENRLAADFIESYGLGTLAGGGGHGEEAVDKMGKGDAPLEHLHAAHGPSDGGVEFGDADGAEPTFLGTNHVGDGNDGEVDAKGLTGGGVDRERTGGALAAADDVTAEDKVAVGVEGFAGADDVVPPAGFAVREAMDTGTVMIAREGVADEDGVVAGGIEAAVGLVANRESGDSATTVEVERLV